MNVEKHMQHWRDGAFDALETALILAEQGRRQHALFFCHLAVEKLLKSKVVAATKEVAPKSHDLLYLAKKAGIELGMEVGQNLAWINNFNLEGRYSEFAPRLPSKDEMWDGINLSKTIMQWLETR